MPLATFGWNLPRLDSDCSLLIYWNRHGYELRICPGNVRMRCRCPDYDATAFRSPMLVHSKTTRTQSWQNFKNHPPRQSPYFHSHAYICTLYIIILRLSQSLASAELLQNASANPTAAKHVNGYHMTPFMCDLNPRIHGTTGRNEGAPPPLAVPAPHPDVGVGVDPYNKFLWTCIWVSAIKKRNMVVERC